MVEQGLEDGLAMRDDRWSESIAVGSLAFIDKVKSELGFRVKPVPIVQAVQPLRSVQHVKDNGRSTSDLTGAEAYGLSFAGENEALNSQNTFFWNDIVDQAKT